MKRHVLLLAITIIPLSGCDIFEKDNVQKKDYKLGEEYKREIDLLNHFPEKIRRINSGSTIYINNKVSTRLDIKVNDGEQCYLSNVINIFMVDHIYQAPVIRCDIGDIFNYTIYDDNGKSSYFDGPISSSPDGKFIIIGSPGPTKYAYDEPSSVFIYSYPAMIKIASFENYCKPVQWIDNLSFEAECYSKDIERRVDNIFFKSIDGKWQIIEKMDQ